MSSFSKILIPIDFSPHSVAAARYGSVFFGRSSAKVILAHVVPSIDAISYAFPMNSPEVEASQRQAVETELKKLAGEIFGEKSDVEIVVTNGDIYDQLLRIAEENKADLIVMGTQGRRNLGRWFLGSVTERLLRQVHIPIMTVSQADKPGSMEVPAALQHVLYATDLSDQSTAAVKLAIELAQVSRARLTVLHVLEYRDFILWGGAVVQFSESKRMTIVEDTKGRMDSLVKDVNSAGLEVETVVAEGKPYEKILRYAEHHDDVGLIVLNLQGKSLVERAALGSTAERVVRLAHVPVLSVPIPKSNA